MHDAPIDGASRGYAVVEGRRRPIAGLWGQLARLFGPTFGPIAAVVLSALAFALEAAAKAGRFDVVVQLAKELEARRSPVRPTSCLCP